MRHSTTIAAVIIGGFLMAGPAGAQTQQPAMPPWIEGIGLDIMPAAYRNAGFLRNSSWYATEVDGPQFPYQIMFTNPPCGFRLQFNEVWFEDVMIRSGSIMPNDERLHGIAVQMTSPDCRQSPRTRAQINIDFDIHPEYWGFGFGAGLINGTTGMSADSREIRFVGSIGNLGDTGADLQRIRIRFNDANNPDSGRVFIESRRNNEWRVDSTINIQRDTNTSGIWGAPQMQRAAEGGSATPGGATGAAPPYLPNRQPPRRIQSRG